MEASITIRLPADLRERLEKLAEEDGRPLGNFIRRHLERVAPEKKRRR